MRNISWCPCLNTRLNLHISINCDKRAVVHSTNVVFKMTVITTDPVTNTTQQQLLTVLDRKVIFIILKHD